MGMPRPGPGWSGVRGSTAGYSAHGACAPAGLARFPRRESAQWCKLLLCAHRTSRWQHGVEFADLGDAPMRWVCLALGLVGLGSAALRRAILRTAPARQQVSLGSRDASPPNGASYYYVRIEQADGNTAWSSPIWVTLP